MYLWRYALYFSVDEILEFINKDYKSQKQKSSLDQEESINKESAKLNWIA